MGTHARSIQAVFENFVVMRTLVKFIKNCDDLKSFRLLTRTTNYVVIGQYQRTNYLPVVKIQNDWELTNLINWLENRMPNINTIKGYHFETRLHSVYDTNFGIPLSSVVEFMEVYNELIFGLSILIPGVMTLSQIELPRLPNLTKFVILSNVGFPLPPIAPINSTVLPALKTFVFRGLNFLDLYFDGTVMPTVSNLELDFTFRVHGVSFEDPIETMESLPRIFPNLVSLKLCNKSYTNFERVAFVLTKMSSLEKLTLFTNQSTLGNRNEDYERTFTGDLLPQMTKMELVNQFRNQIPGTPTQPDQDGMYGTPSLANMKGLKQMDITISNVTHLRVLVFMSRPHLLIPLEKLTIRLAPENTIKQWFTRDYLHLLRQYHQTVEYINNPRRRPPPRLFPEMDEEN